MATNDRPALMRRRDFLRTVSLAAAAATLPRPARAAEAAKRKPNVLFIAIDDLNDWIGCLGGHPQSRTPNLDRLAKRGVLFTSAHCAAPACNPSRAALMTGIRPSTSGIYHNPQPWRKSPVLKDAVTLPQYFMAHGYEAIGGGKIYHGGFPDPPSWNSYFPDQKRNKPPDPKPPKTNVNGLGKSHFDWGPLTVGDQEMGAWFKKGLFGVTVSIQVVAHRVAMDGWVGKARDAKRVSSGGTVDIPELPTSGDETCRSGVRLDSCRHAPAGRSAENAGD